MSIPYVSADALGLAAEWARRFQALPPHAGVIFASVKAVPVESGTVRIFEVRLGLVSTLEESTGLSLIKHVLSEEIASGKYEIQGAVYRGVRCAGGAAPRADTRPNPS